MKILCGNEKMFDKEKIGCIFGGLYKEKSIYLKLHHHYIYSINCVNIEEEISLIYVHLEKLFKRESQLGKFCPKEIGERKLCE